MNFQTATANRKLLIVAGPALAIVVLYIQFIYGPIRQHAKSEASRLRKLESMSLRVDIATDARQLVELHDEIRTLSETLESSSDGRRTFVKHSSDSAADDAGTFGPASAIAELLQVLERNKLECVDSQLTQNPPQNDSDSSLPVSQTAMGSKRNPLDHLYTLTVHGTFLDLQAALRELNADTHAVDLVSIELTQVNGQFSSAARTWVLKVRA